MNVSLLYFRESSLMYLNIGDCILLNIIYIYIYLHINYYQVKVPYRIYYSSWLDLICDFINHHHKKCTYIYGCSIIRR